MKLILIIVTGLLAAYPALDADGLKLPWLSRLSSKCKKCVCWIVALLLALGQAYIDNREDQESECRYNEQKDLNAKLQARFDAVNDRLSAATGQVAATQSALQSANEALAAQQRSIGSLLYNIETSYEGKSRFARSFDALSLMDAENEYCSLICDDGVAVFRFVRTDGALLGFYFYSNSEVNEVLAGMPLGSQLKMNKGRLVIQKESELALALERAIERKMPRLDDNPILRQLALDALAERMRQFFRYVYRAENYSQRETKPFGWRVVFSYDVSPAKDDSCRRAIEFWLTGAEVEGFCGLSMRELSEKLLAYCRAKGCNPKIRRNDVRELSAKIKTGEDKRTFPYTRERVSAPSRD